MAAGHTGPGAKQTRTRFVGNDAFFDCAERIAGAFEFGVDQRQGLGGKVLVEQDFDGALKEARNHRVVGIYPRPLAGERTLDEQRMPLSGGRPQHAPVADAICDSLAAVVGQADK